MSYLFLRGMTWDHPRGVDPLVACSAAFERQHNIRIAWSARSLADFEAFPLDLLAKQFDLIVIDHPHVGTVAASGCLRPFDPSIARKLNGTTVGFSHESYNLFDQQWALSLDAAAQVAAWGQSYRGRIPILFSDVIELAQGRTRVLWPLAPVHALMTFFSLCANVGSPCATCPTQLVDVSIAKTVLRAMCSLAGLLDRRCFEWTPIDVLTRLVDGDADYVPYVYGYISYARHGFGPGRVQFGDMPGLVSGHCNGSTLGGTGLAVSALLPYSDHAIAFAQFAASAETQSSLYTSSGGQPAHRAAWEEAAVDAECGGFFSGTRRTLDNAYIRPRFDGYIAFQALGGQIVSECLQGRAAHRRDGPRPQHRICCSPGTLPMIDDLSSKPLDGLLVLDFALFLAGPLCALRLADLGARVIKIERPAGGDLCRQLYINDLRLDDDSMLFHTINRNKQSFAADLKDPSQLEQVRRLVARADVMITNFRPGVMDRLGLGYPATREINPNLVYGNVSGYGDAGPWANKPGQDLLAQSLSGLLWLTGDQDAPPTPMGLAVADMFAGHALCEGVLAALVRRWRTGGGGLVETSLLEALLDFQFEVLGTHLNDGGKLPPRAALGSAHAYLGAPYGVYRTADAWIALAMVPLGKLGPLIGLPELADVSRTDTFARRDDIKATIATRLRTKSNADWLSIFEPADVWCAPVLAWPQLLETEAFKALKMIQTVTRPSTGSAHRALRSPIRIDGTTSVSPLGSPAIGEHTEAIRHEFNLVEGKCNVAV